ncbi:AP-3 complex subunit beta, partial [Tremellales sp. Uapishka_1]
MAAFNRLSQRIKENFQETTRDLSLLAGGSSSSNAAYFETSDDKVKEISKLLESRVERERLEGMKRIIAGISKGRDMEAFFAQVVKNVVAPSIEIRKLVYIYLLRFASTNSDLLLLSINTFQKDLSDPSPLIRSMSLRVLTSIRVPVIQGIVMLGLKKLVTDRNPWVRKTVAGGLAKVYEMDPSSLPSLIPILQTLLSSPSPLTLGATLTAFLEICPDRLDLLHPYYRHIVNLVVDADEWGQVVTIEVLVRYIRANLEKPEVEIASKGEEDADEFEGLDEDLAMFLHLSKPLFQSRNPAVVLSIAKAYYQLAPIQHKIVGQDRIVEPLLTLGGGEGEIANLSWEVIGGMVEERPILFVEHHSAFFLHAADSALVKKTKLKSMTALVSAENAQTSMREFKHYLRFPEDSVAESAIQAIGHLVRTQPEVSSLGLSALMKLLKSTRDTLVAQAVIVLKSVIPSLPNPAKLVARLAKRLDGISNPSARSSVYWLVGQYAEPVTGGELPLGEGWVGVALWVPDLFRKAVKGFVDETSTAKLQILTLASKLLVLSSSAQLVLISQYLFQLARYDSDYDLRDRSRFLHALLKGIRDEKDSSVDDEEEHDVGGVILRREQIKLVIFGNGPSSSNADVGGSHGDAFEVATMSRVMKKKLKGYERVSEWTDDPTDPSLRDSEEATPIPTPTPLPTHLAIGSNSLPARINSPLGASPAGSVIAAPAPKSKFKDLDAFLDSSEEESEEESDSDTRPAPVRAPPRSAIVPEYDEETSSEDEEEEDEEDDSESGDERRPLYGGTSR